MLTPTNVYRSTSAGDVEFLMMSGSRQVICIATKEALQSLAEDSDHVGETGLLDVFVREHSRVEAAASDLFDRRISAPVVKAWHLAKAAGPS